MAKAILEERRGSFLYLTLNRPRSGNVMSATMIRALTKAVRAVSREDGLRAVILRGKGPDFCLGRDPGQRGASPTAWQVHEQVTSLILDAYAACRHCPVPVIAAVQGHARGFGSGLAGTSDIVLATETATFSTPEMLHGIAPTLVMTALQDVHRKALADLIYWGEPVTAETALAIGLVSRVVPDDELDAAVDAYCERLEHYDTNAISVIKGFLGQPGHMHPDQLSDLADFTLATAFTRPR
ncbi:MAG: enoyl-CoA hydratase/isomerase family protein [Pseudomonadota bacterium]